MSHYNMVNNPISIFYKKKLTFQQQELHWTEFGCCENETELSLCIMITNTTKRLVDRTLPHLNTPQIIHGSSATISQTYYIRRTLQNRFPLKTLNINGWRGLILRTRLA